MTNSRQTDDTFADAVKGLLLLAAYGDALGAPHERNGLAGKIRDPHDIGPLAMARAFHLPGANGQPWNVWADADAIPDVRSPMTDDTAFRLMLSQPWLATVVQEGRRFCEVDFTDWLRAARHDGEPPGLPAGVWGSRREQIDGWLEMYSAADEKGQSGFFKFGVPVVFGLFQFFDLGVLWVNEAPERVWRVFRPFCRLDQGYAGVVTGVMATVLAHGTGKQIAPEVLGTAFRESSAAILQRLIRYEESASDREHLRLMEDLLDEMWRFGVDHRRVSGYGFLSVLHDTLAHHPRAPFNAREPALRSFDPLLFWMQIVACVAYSDQNPLEALGLLSSTSGDSDTVASVFGATLGAWSGFRQLKQMTASGTSLASELQLVERTIKTLFGVDLADRPVLFSKAKTLLPQSVE